MSLSVVVQRHTADKKLTIAAGASRSDSVAIGSAISGQVRAPVSWGTADIGFAVAAEDNAYRPTADALSPAPSFDLVRDRVTGDVVSLKSVSAGDWQDVPDAVLKNRYLKLVALAPGTEVEQAQITQQQPVLTLKT